MRLEKDGQHFLQKAHRRGRAYTETVFSVEFYISPVSLNVAGENKPRLTSPTARRCAASTVDAPLSFAREAYSAPTTTTATALSRLAVATPAAEPGARREDRAFG